MKTIKFSKTIISLSALIFMGYTLFISPLTALAVVSQPVSTPVSIPISIPVPIPVIVPGAPEMVYPGNGQTLVLEDAYMFKVKPVTGASRYLFGFSQNGVMISENYSSNGEFAIWPNDPVHTQFQAGNVTVSIKALVNGNWTDAREITIILKSKIPAPTPTPEASPSASLLPAPEIVYPANGQTLILEDGYMFKVNLVEGASGYLYRLYQDNVLVFEDYNSNGESALWPDNPFHAQFHEGQVKVAIAAVVNNGWTQTREITITLKSRIPASLASIVSMVAPVLGTNPKPTLNPVLNQSYKVTVKSATLAPTVTISTPSAVLTPIKPATVSTYKPNIIEILLAFLRRLWFS